MQAVDGREQPSDREHLIVVADCCLLNTVRSPLITQNALLVAVWRRSDCVEKNQLAAFDTHQAVVTMHLNCMK